MYCSSLNFYQPNRKMSNKKRNDKDRSLSNISRSARSRSAFSEKRKNTQKKEHADTSAINISAIEVSLDEECENQHFSLRSLMAAEDMYEPVSLCLVSKFPLFDALQVRACERERMRTGRTDDRKNEWRRVGERKEREREEKDN